MLSFRSFPVCPPTGEFKDFSLRLLIFLFALGPAKCLLRPSSEGLLDDLDDVSEVLVSGAVGACDLQESHPDVSTSRMQLLPCSGGSHLLHRILLYFHPTRIPL